MQRFTTPSPTATKTTQGSAFRHKSSSPWRVVRFSPYLANPLLPQFKSSGSIEAPIPNPIFRPLPEKVVRLTLPFSLRQNGIPRGPTREEVNEIKKLFPSLESVGHQHPYLVVSVHQLPPQPWPTIIADLPLWLTTPLAGGPRTNIGKIARLNQKFNVKGEIKEYEAPSNETIAEIFALVNEKGAGISELQFDGCVFRAIGASSQEPESGWQNRLPASVNGFTIGYKWTESTMEEHAVRMEVPCASNIDDTTYGPSELRPGILLAGFHNNMIDSLSTTSGVCVQSPTSGKKFITVAAHGFVAGVGDVVYHPKCRLVDGNPDPRYQIATIARKFGDTDIALAELKPGIRYLGDTFSDPHPDQPQVQPFRLLKSPMPLHYGDPVYMNTPVNGQCEGIHVKTSWKVVEATDREPQEDQTEFQIGEFSYWGNGSDVFFDGSCGGVIWDENFDILGQFRFQEKDGDRYAFSTTFNCLIKQGYQLSTV